ncbi:MAG: hypothetical protein JSV34_06895, partial [Candidatus Omnitrophota bacterium]
PVVGYLVVLGIINPLYGEIVVVSLGALVTLIAVILSVGSLCSKAWLQKVFDKTGITSIRQSVWARYSTLLDKAREEVENEDISNINTAALEAMVKKNFVKGAMYLTALAERIWDEIGKQEPAAKGKPFEWTPMQQEVIFGLIDKWKHSNIEGARKILVEMTMSGGKTKTRPIFALLLYFMREKFDIDTIAISSYNAVSSKKEELDLAAFFKRFNIATAYAKTEQELSEVLAKGWVKFVFVEFNKALTLWSHTKDLFKRVGVLLNEGDLMLVYRLFDPLNFLGTNSLDEIQKQEFMQNYRRIVALTRSAWHYRVGVEFDVYNTATNEEVKLPIGADLSQPEYSEITHDTHYIQLKDSFAEQLSIRDIFETEAYLTVQYLWREKFYEEKNDEVQFSQDDTGGLAQGRVLRDKLIQLFLYIKEGLLPFEEGAIFNEEQWDRVASLQGTTVESTNFFIFVESLRVVVAATGTPDEVIKEEMKFKKICARLGRPQFDKDRAERVKQCSYLTDTAHRAIDAIPQMFDPAGACAVFVEDPANIEPLKLKLEVPQDNIVRRGDEEEDINKYIREKIGLPGQTSIITGPVSRDADFRLQEGASKFYFYIVGSREY